MSPRALVRSMTALSDPREALRQVVDRVLEVVPGADAALATLEPPREETTVISSDDLATALYAAQVTAAQGPTLDALTELAVVRSDDLATDPRYPILAPACVGLGVLNAIAFPVIVDDNSTGTITVLARSAGSLTERAERIGAPLAAVAGLVIARIGIGASFAEAMDSRDVIGQAKGILMERHKLGPDEAFDRLRAFSQHQNRRLRDIAEDIASTGEEPPAP